MQRRLSIVTVAAIALVALAGTAAAQDLVWRYNQSAPYGTNSASYVAASPDGAIVAAGISTGDDYTPDWIVVKLSAVSGETLWTRGWSSGPDMTDSVRALVVDDSANIFVVGITRPAMLGHLPDYVTQKYSPDGTLEWTEFYDNGAFDRADAALADGAGGVFVTGSSQYNIVSPNTRDILTIHYGTDGGVLWTARFDGPASWNDYGWAMAQPRDRSALYVQGHVYVDAVSRYDYITIKYDMQGDTLWTRTHAGSGTNPARPDFSVAVAVDDDDNVYCTGMTGELMTLYDATTIKYAPDGTKLWTNVFDNGLGTNDYAYRLALGPDNSVYIAGASYYDPYSEAVCLMAARIDAATGDSVWRWFFGPRYPDGEDTLTDMKVDAHGNVYLAAYAYSFNDDYVWEVFKLSPQGQQIWTVADSILDEDNECYSLALDANGDVYVAGHIEGGAAMQVNKYTEADAGVLRIVMPADSFRIDARVTPQAWVRSYSSNQLLNTPVRMEIGGFYNSSANVPNLAPHDSVLVSFDVWTVRDVGTHVASAWTQLSGDKDRVNDTAYAAVTVLPAWERLANLPAGPRGKEVKDGGALGYDGAAYIYAFKGNNTTEFYRYAIATDSWQARETIPYYGTTGRKRVKGGAQLEADTSGYVWALKGNNTREFWRYSVSGDSWREMDNVPPGPGGKKVKGGSGLCYVPSKRGFYAAKGANTQEFYFFDVAADSWFKKGDVPMGRENKRVKDGSALAYDGDHTLYMTKGSSLGFWSYNTNTDTWTQRDDIRYTTVDPLNKRRKFKKGAGLAFDPSAGRAYATKGGKGREFWFFDVAADTWLELPETDLFPMQVGGKPPYNGADMVYAAGKLYATKGNRTFEFYRYNADLPLSPGGLDGQQVFTAAPALRVQLTASPNPFNRRTVLHYSLPQAGRVRLALYDVTGRVVRTVSDGWQAAGSHALPLSADGLAAGIYLARLRLGNEVFTVEATQKVLITR